MMAIRVYTLSMHLITSQTSIFKKTVSNYSREQKTSHVFKICDGGRFVAILWPLHHVRGLGEPPRLHPRSLGRRAPRPPRCCRKQVPMSADDAPTLGYVRVGVVAHWSTERQWIWARARPPGRSSPGAVPPRVEPPRVEPPRLHRVHPRGSQSAPLHDEASPWPPPMPRGGRPGSSWRGLEGGRHKTGAFSPRSSLSLSRFAQERK